jgi:hypothetical protein
VSSSSNPLEKQVGVLLERYVRQNGLAELSTVETTTFAARLCELIEVRGLPRRLQPDEMGEPVEMSAEAVAPLIACLLEGSTRSSELSTVARQLVKACFHPEFKKCRDSYRETASDGTCRRQELDRVRARVSGSHCVDCPYWTALTAGQDAALVADGWVGDAGLLAAHHEIFLPEDFRVFRRLVRALASEVD